VTIQTDTYPEVFHGRIAYVAASLDPNTRTLQARIETGNPGEKLKKDMYVVATVNAGSTKDAIALPDAAVLRDTENQPFVYAAASSNQFGRRSVIRDRDCGRPHLAPLHRVLRQSRLVRDGRPRRRCIAGLIPATHDSSRTLSPRDEVLRSCP